MKKVILILIFAFIGAVSYAQFGMPAYDNVVVGDTVSNSHKVTHYITASAGYRNASFQVNIARLTGNVYGYVKIFGTVDGTHYPATALDSVRITVETGTSAPIFTITNSLYYRYKITVANDSSGTGQVKIYYLLHKTITQ